MMNIVSGNYRSLLGKLFTLLDYHGIDYCVCGNYENLPDSTGHDVDLWVSDIDSAYKYLKISASTCGAEIYLNNRTANGYNIFLCKPRDNSIELFHIDLLQDCSWFSFIPLVGKNVIYQNRCDFKGFMVANSEIETVMHLLYPLLTFGLVKTKYRNKVYLNRNSTILKEQLALLFGKKVSGHILEHINKKKWDDIQKIKNKLRAILIYRFFKNAKMSELKGLFTFFRLNIIRLIRPAGLFIVFIGLDGAGKTTVINSLGEFFKEGFTSKKIRKYYWRPFLLPEPGKMIGWFRRHVRTNFKESSTEFFDYRVSKTKYSFFKCPFYLLKFFYYLLDFSVGRIKYQGAWSRGGVVCFDRYYYDLQVFPERFGFKVPKTLIHFFSRFVPKPDICFYLYSPSKILFERKGEVPEEEIVRQTTEYDYLLKSSSSFIKIDTSKTIEETRSEIISSCLDKMRSRYD